jgi:hypothetical protein
MHPNKFRDNIKAEPYPSCTLPIDVGPSIETFKESGQRILRDTNTRVFHAYIDSSPPVALFALMLAERDSNGTAEWAVFNGIL